LPTSRIRTLFGFEPGAARFARLSYRQWVWIFVALSAAIQSVLSWLYYQDFHAQEGGDLAIWMQALWSTSHGRLYWETTSYIRTGVPTLLGIHFSWVAFAIFPVYWALPSPTTLFVIQAAVVALAALPLQRLTQLVTGSPKKGLVAACLYLIWAPLYTGMPGTFHLESFLPLELFGLVLLWCQGRYLLGLIVGAFAGFTLDVGPVLSFLIGAMFLTYPIQSLWVRGSQRTAVARDPPGSSGPSMGPSGASEPVAERSPAPWGRRLYVMLRTPLFQMSLALMAVSVAVFFGVRYLEADFPGWVGLSGPSLPILRVAGLAYSNWSTSLPLKIEFWLLLFATVGFLPFLYPRVAILLAPWMLYTFLEAQNEWYNLLTAYVAIAAVPLFIGVAFGLKRISFTEEIVAPSDVPEAEPVGDEEEEGTSQRSVAPATGPRRARTARRTRAYTVASIVIAAAFLLNVALSPLTPEIQSDLYNDGNPLFHGDPYNFNYPLTPGFAAVQSLSGIIPAHGRVLTTPTLLPLLSHDPSAYPTGVYPFQYLPFNATDLPSYVLANTGSLFTFNVYLVGFSQTVWNTSVYGVRGWVQNSPLGSVFVFQLGYTGPAQAFGPLVPEGFQFAIGSGLFAGPSSQVATVTLNGNQTKVINAIPNGTGAMWSVEDVATSLPGGVYSAAMKIDVPVGPFCPSGSTTAVDLNVSARVPSSVPSVAAGSVNGSAPCGVWTVVDLPLTLTAPIPGFVLSASRSAPELSALQTASVALTPAPVDES
jgi:uncharacterized membrane protein